MISSTNRKPLKNRNGKTALPLRLLLSCLKFIIPLLLGIYIGLAHKIFTNGSGNIVVESPSGILPSSTNNNNNNIINNNNNNNNNNDHPYLKHPTDNNGWHPIFVYYGKKEAIKSSNPPMHQKGNNINKSQVKQDEIIAALISKFRKVSSGLSNKQQQQQQQQPPPYFVDLAANDAVSLSNTYQLEQSGWDGLCIEPNPVYWFRLAHRKCTVAGAFVGGKTDLQEVEVALNNKEFGGIVGDEFDNNNAMGKEIESVTNEKRFTVSIRSLFDTFHVPPIIDYLSLDVEGAEELIMSDFPFDTHTIRFITIERPKLGLQSLMKEKKYHFVKRLVLWGETLWVHESIFEKMSLEEINTIIAKTNPNLKGMNRQRKGRRYFDVESGTFMS